jgi:prepilin-type N-terminal cleavage/methylation domain-containing protein
MNSVLNNHSNMVRTTQAGFTLVELAIVMFIIAMLFVFTMPVSTSLLNNQRRDITKIKMKTVEAALANYVAVHKRLPCPADGASTAGVELRAGAIINGVAADFTVDCAANTGTPANTNQQTGVVPWVTLGLTRADVLDGWENQMTFRVAFGLTQANALDMSACDPAGTADTTPSGVSPLPPVNTVINVNVCNAALTCTGTGTACSKPQMFLANKGFTVVDGADLKILDPSIYTGAAYILISHGDNGVGAFTNSQLLLTSPLIGANGPLEALNHNNGHGVLSTSTTIFPKFRDAGQSFASGTAATDAVYFDDLIIRPTVFSLIQRAQLGPRSH